MEFQYLPKSGIERFGFTYSYEPERNDEWVYVTGGKSMKDYQMTKLCFKFNLINQKWTQIASLNTSKYGATAFQSSDCQYLYNCGGF